MIVVIPSNRSINLDHLGPLIESGARFVVVDDSPGSIRIDHPQFRVFSWADRERLLGAHDVAIPRRNGACRDLGFVVAWKEAAELPVPWSAKSTGPEPSTRTRQRTPPHRT
jgi:hypothetical protein